jgi:hypothetical protein
MIILLKQIKIMAYLFNCSYTIAKFMLKFNVHRQCSYSRRFSQVMAMFTNSRRRNSHFKATHVSLFNAANYNLPRASYSANDISAYNCYLHKLYRYSGHVLLDCAPLTNGQDDLGNRLTILLRNQKWPNILLRNDLKCY